MRWALIRVPSHLQVTEEMFRLPPVSLYREPPLDDMEHGQLTSGHARHCSVVCNELCTGDGVSGDESEARHCSVVCNELYVHR